MEGLVLGYGRTTVVHGISLRVEPGQIVALIGANGAGKTTVMRAVSGLLRPRGGRIVYAGADIAGHPAHSVAAAGLRQVPEGRQVFGSLTVADNLALGAYTVPDAAERGRRRDAVLTRFPRLRERLRQPAGARSGG